MGLPVASRGDGGGAEVVGLQPVALIDHVARVGMPVLEAVPGEHGGSLRVSREELERILEGVRGQGEQTVRTLAGGSVANTIRGLAGLGVRCGLVGARGDDACGDMFAAAMTVCKVGLKNLRVGRGPTGQCACLVDDSGGRTMRPCMADAVGMDACELRAEHFKGASWVVLNGYGFYRPELLERAAALARESGAKVSMDLGSFEVVRAFRPQLLGLLESGLVDLCFANEDEARELMAGQRGARGRGDARHCLDFLAKFCGIAVVMMGARGCEARRGKEAVRVGAMETVVVDTTGAGDLFAAGFIACLLRGGSLEECCRLGCASGAAVVRDLGGEIKAEGWDWLRLHSIKTLPKFLQFLDD